MGDALLSDGGAQEVLAMSVYGWWFEQFLSKQGAAMVDNDNGRTAPATKVVFDENGAALNILEAWRTSTKAAGLPMSAAAAATPPPPTSPPAKRR